jgi:hypothetical protein
VPSSLAPASPFDVIADGDQVIGTGRLLESATGTVTLCRHTVSFAIEGGSVGCSAIDNVSVAGIDPHSFPGEQRGDTWMSDYVRVAGTWVHGVLNASSARTIVEPIPPNLTVPCPAPVGGWPGNDQSRQQSERQASLEGALQGHWGEYSGTWAAPISGSKETAVVVGTVADPESVRAELSGIYPYNLCVVSAKYSQDELLHVQSALAATGQRWDLGFVPWIDRVTVTTPVLYQSMADALVPYADQVVVDTTIIQAAAGTFTTVVTAKDGSDIVSTGPMHFHQVRSPSRDEGQSSSCAGNPACLPDLSQP